MIKRTLIFVMFFAWIITSCEVFASEESLESLDLQNVFHFHLTPQMTENFSDPDLFAFSKICAINSTLPSIYVRFYDSLLEYCREYRWKVLLIDEHFMKTFSLLKKAITLKDPSSLIPAIESELCFLNLWIYDHSTAKDLEIFKNTNREHLKNISEVYAALDLDSKFETKNIEKINHVRHFLSSPTSLLEGEIEFTWEEAIPAGTLFNLISSSNPLDVSKLTFSKTRFRIFRINERDFTKADFAIFRSPDKCSLLLLSLRDIYPPG